MPGFDPSGMSDDELMQKAETISRRLAYMGRFGSFEAIDQLQAMGAMIDNERRERAVREYHAMRQSMQPDIIESDPDLIVRKDTEQENADEVAKAAAKRRAARNRQITKVVERPVIVKSSTPQRDE